MIIYITIVYRLTVVITVVAIITDTFVFNYFTVISRGRSEKDRVRESEASNSRQAEIRVKVCITPVKFYSGRC